MARKQQPICLGKEENLPGLGEYTNGKKKKKRLYFWSRFDAKYLFSVFFNISEQLSNYSSNPIWIAFIPSGQYSLEAMRCSERAFVMRTSSLSQFQQHSGHLRFYINQVRFHHLFARCNSYGLLFKNPINFFYRALPNDNL